jgi:transcriptional regulator with XRE-family HTH domain
MQQMAAWKDGLRTLGQMLRSHRIAADLTQAALARRAGISGKYVSEIERGTRDVPFSTLHALVHDGLRRRLEHRFADPGGHTNGNGLPRLVAEVARAIADLPEERRAVVLAIVRAALRLASE